MTVKFVWITQLHIVLTLLLLVNIWVKESLAMSVIAVLIDKAAEMIVVVDVVESALVLLAEDTIAQEAAVDLGLVKI